MTGSPAEEFLAELEQGSFALQPMWANFEKLIVLIPEELRRGAADEIERAFSSLPMFRVYVADKFLKELSISATPCKSANDVAAVPDGKSFLYVGPQLYCPGLTNPRNDEDGNKRSLLKIGTASSGVQSTGYARLSHSLVSSVHNLTSPGNKFLFGIKTGERDFIPLIAGSRLFSLEERPAIDSEGFDQLKPDRTIVISPRGFVDVVVRDLRSLVEFGNTWKLVNKRGANDTSQESDFQLLFEVFCNLLGPQYDISVDPQANHGAGNLDICLSRGAEGACCVELKLSTSGELKHGLEKQLPAYMEAKGADEGVYVVCCTEDGLTPDEVRNLLGEPPTGITIITIDARSRPSASKL